MSVSCHDDRQERQAGVRRTGGEKGGGTELMGDTYLVQNIGALAGGIPWCSMFPVTMANLIGATMSSADGGVVSGARRGEQRRPLHCHGPNA